METRKAARRWRNWLNILFIGKWPPIQGGVARESFNFVKEALRNGHSVTVVTNASCIEAGFKISLFGNDQNFLEGGLDSKLTIIDVCKDGPGSLFHIPFSHPYVELLAGASLIATTIERFDVIVGSYIEPYGIAASIVAAHTNIPYFIRHAGSDIGRLAKNPYLKNFYSTQLSHCAGVLTHPSPKVEALLKDIGFHNDRRIEIPRSPFDLFSLRHVVPYDLVAHLEETKLNKAYQHFEWEAPDGKPSRDDLVVKIGMYGKVGDSKGTYKLLDALSGISHCKQRFHLYLIGAGTTQQLQRLHQRIVSEYGLMDNVTVLAPLAPWRISGFIEFCDIVAFLEHDFSVEIHAPQVPFEIAFCNRICLVPKAQISSNFLEASLVDGVNSIIVENMSTPDELAQKLGAALTDTELLSRLRSNARSLRELIWGQSARKADQVQNGMLAALERAAVEQPVERYG